MTKEFESGNSGGVEVGLSSSLVYGIGRFSAVAWFIVLCPVVPHGKSRIYMMTNPILVLYDLQKKIISVTSLLGVRGSKLHVSCHIYSLSIFVVLSANMEYLVL